MALTFTQQQELETLIEEFKQENRLYGTVQITMNNEITLFRSIKGFDEDTYEKDRYVEGYEDGYSEGYDDGYSRGYDEGGE